MFLILDHFSIFGSVLLNEKQRPSSKVIIFSESQKFLECSETCVKKLKSWPGPSWKCNFHPHCFIQFKKYTVIIRSGIFSPIIFVLKEICQYFSLKPPNHQKNECYEIISDVGKCVTLFPLKWLWWKLLKLHFPP